MKNFKNLEYALYIFGVILILFGGAGAFSHDFTLHGKSYLLTVLIGIGFIIIGRTIVIERAIKDK